jgi:hypothetical protein
MILKNVESQLVLLILALTLGINPVDGLIDGKHQQNIWLMLG